ncbi:MAG TPA: hypothetical protein VHP12_03555 [Chitinophagaceae bacterium]|nr:hypothetical protein [Chitinophagaceae bacterium]
MKIKITTCINLLLLFLLNGCTHYYYIPNVQNVPMFRQKGEARVSLQLGGEDQTSTYEIHTAYSVTNHIAVMANYMSAFGGKKDSVSSWAQGNYYEVAIGYYKTLNKSFVFETYFGSAIGNQHHQYSVSDFWYGGTYNNGNSDLACAKFFIQPSIGVKLKAFDFALSTRLSNLNFNRIENHLYTNNYEFTYLDQIDKSRNSFLLESALTIRFGRVQCKLQLQAQYSDNLTHQNLKFNNSNISLGLRFAFSNKDLQSIFKKRSNR